MVAVTNRVKRAQVCAEVQGRPVQPLIFNINVQPELLRRLLPRESFNLVCRPNYRGNKVHLDSAILPQKTLVLVLRGVHGLKLYNALMNGSSSNEVPLFKWTRPAYMKIYSPTLPWLLQVQKDYANLQKELRGRPWSSVLQHPVIRNLVDVPEEVTNICLPTAVKEEDLIPFSDLKYIPLMSECDKYCDHTYVGKSNWGLAPESSQMFGIDTEFISTTYGYEAHEKTTPDVINLSRAKKLIQQAVACHDVLIIHDYGSEMDSLKIFSLFVIDTSTRMIQKLKLQDVIPGQNVSLNTLSVLLFNVPLQLEETHSACLDALMTLFSYLVTLKREYLLSKGLNAYRAMLGFTPISQADVATSQKLKEFVTNNDINVISPDIILRVLQRLVLDKGEDVDEEEKVRDQVEEEPEEDEAKALTKKEKRKIKRKERRARKKQEKQKAKRDLKAAGQGMKRRGEPDWDAKERKKQKVMPQPTSMLDHDIASCSGERQLASFQISQPNQSVSSSEDEDDDQVETKIPENELKPVQKYQGEHSGINIIPFIKDPSKVILVSTEEREIDEVLSDVVEDNLITTCVAENCKTGLDVVEDIVFKNSEEFDVILATLDVESKDEEHIVNILKRFQSSSSITGYTPYIMAQGCMPQTLFTWPCIPKTTLMLLESS